MTRCLTTWGQPRPQGAFPWLLQSQKSTLGTRLTRGLTTRGLTIRNFTTRGLRSLTTRGLTSRSLTSGGFLLEV